MQTLLLLYLKLGSAKGKLYLLARGPWRTLLICDDVLETLEDKRSPVILTERKDQHRILRIDCPVSPATSPC
jgi:hypothetical protein